MKLLNSFKVHHLWTFEGIAPLKVKDTLLRRAEKAGLIIPVARNNEIALKYYNKAKDLLGIDDRYLLGGGHTLFRSTVKNITVNEGLDEMLDKFWKGSTYTAAHYVGLADGTPSFAAGDTMGSHAGWTEVTDYSEANRQDLTLGTVSSQSVDNSSNKASFSINSDSTTVGGGFISTDNTKGGTAGILIGGAADSGGDQTVNSGSTINITATLTASSS